uniref:Integrin alpha-2 domain-containing protein n=1 Tax=Astatotilapia calliptera TaxID=8154 RepID=A0AAX7SG79_ASTCA
MAGTRTAALLVLVCLHFHRSSSFNLDVDNPFVYPGPEGSYFGFSVDFFKPSNNLQSDVLIGAPRANMSADSIVERGAVYSCPWGRSSACQQLVFDNKDERTRDGAKMEFKSKQWFGASVRSDGEHILACAPLYQWSTLGVSEREPVGTCYLKKGNQVVEYSPCRTGMFVASCPSICSGILFLPLPVQNDKRVVVGGPGSFYWQGQLISDDVSEIFTRFTNDYFTRYGNTLSTKSANAQYDDSYLVSICSTFYASTDFVTGVPRGEKALGYVSVTIIWCSYFVFHLSVSNMDVFVGAPLFMDRGSDGKLREVGQVSVYLGRGGFSFQPPRLLTGSEVYARYGSAIAALGDLNMDGYNDVAISAPYGGPNHNGLVYIHNGSPQGPKASPSQRLEGKWASSYMPPSFGYSMSGNTDIDQNGYPDLIVGVFGADKAVLYRARPVISVNATLDITPLIINPEEKNCTLSNTSTPVSCFKVKYCLKVNGHRAPNLLTFRVHLMLDRLKQKETTKRVFFLHSGTFQYSKDTTVSNGKGPTCEEQWVYLVSESHDAFRDITPISVSMEYSMNYQQAADKTGLQPIVDMSSPSEINKQVHILLDCGPDNICKPDLKLSVKSDRDQIYIGDDNALTLEITAENQGEGAYEAELHIYPPQQADFSGRSQALSRLSCAYKKENQTKMVVCDLGNPMKGGTKMVAELGFSVQQLSEDDTSVRFDLQIVRYGTVFVFMIPASHCSLKCVSRSSSPGQVFIPIANWKPRDPPVFGDDIGPQIVHVYELLNNGPSTFSKAALEVKWPYQFRNSSLLYITSYDTEGPINCTTDIQINPLNVSNPLSTSKNTSTVTPGGRESEGRNQNSVRQRRDLESRNAENDLQTLDCHTAKCLTLKCQVGRLERRKNAILFIYSRLDVNNFLRPENQNRSYVIQSTASFSVIEMPYKNLEMELPSNSTTVSVSVVWVAEPPPPVPGWVVALAVLAGLLLLALLIFIMYKLGFFKRVRPPQEDCIEKEQLQPEENGNTDA